MIWNGVKVSQIDSVLTVNMKIHDAHLVFFMGLHQVYADIISSLRIMSFHDPRNHLWVATPFRFLCFESGKKSVSWVTLAVKFWTWSLCLRVYFPYCPPLYPVLYQLSPTVSCTLPNLSWEYSFRVLWVLPVKLLNYGVLMGSQRQDH